MNHPPPLKLADDQNDGECWQCYCARKGRQHTNGPCRCTEEYRKVARLKALDELTKQAQELDMGY